MPIKRCTHCNQWKPINGFHKDKNGQYGVRGKCKNCRQWRSSNYSKDELKELRRVAAANYRKRNPDKVKFYHQNRRIFTGGKMIRGVIKRPHPRVCELCGDKKHRLVYHHWDDKDLKKGRNVKGVWVCLWCHSIVEAIDKKRLLDIWNRYLNLRLEIEQNVYRKAVLALGKEMK